MPVTKGHSKGAALPQRPIWMTEQGGYIAGSGGNDGVLNAPRATRWIALMYFTQSVVTGDRLSVETAPYWYDVSHGFDSQEVWWRINNFATGPTVLPVRTMQAELYGKTFEKELDFGKYGKNMYIGGKWIAADGSQVLGICGASYGLPSVNLAVTGAASVTFVDAWGNTSSLAVTGGVASFPTSEFPQWIRLPAGVNAELVASDWAWGINYTPQSTVTVTGTRTKLHYLVEEQLRNVYDYDSSYIAGPQHCYYDGSMSYPQTVKWDFRRTITLDQVALFSSVPWQEVSAFTDFTVDISTDNSTWTNVYTHAAPTGTEVQTTSLPWRTLYDDFWHQDWCWLIQFAPASARYVRVIVNAVSYGQNYSSATQTVEFGAAHNYLSFQGMHAFYRAGVNPSQNGAFTDPRDIPGLWGWWDASDTSTLTLVSTTHCSVWQDKSGWGNDLTQSTDANRPVTGTNINSTAALTFNGTSQYMGVGPIPTPSRPGTVFVVARATNTTGGGTRAMVGSTNGSFALSTNNKVGANGSQGMWELSSGTVTQNVGFSATYAELGNANAEAWYALNGTGASTIDGDFNKPWEYIEIGSEYGGVHYFQGQIGEVIIYNRSLSLADRQTVESYLRTKWGTP